MSSLKRQVAAFVVLIVATVLASGCVNIQVIDRSTSTANSMPGVGQEELSEHDLAVLAVDFDPPLVYEEIMARKSRGEGITLLVAVENTGTNTEQDVSVQVQLSDRKGETVFLHKQGVIEIIAPGEIKIVQFRDTDIPFSYEYELRVSVDSVAGETRLADNHKMYDLLITQP
jgi:hypothetical protein